MCSQSASFDHAKRQIESVRMESDSRATLSDSRATQRSGTLTVAASAIFRRNHVLRAYLMKNAYFQLATRRFANIRNVRALERRTHMLVKLTYSHLPDYQCTIFEACQQHRTCATTYNSVFYWILQKSKLPHPLPPSPTALCAKGGELFRPPLPIWVGRKHCYNDKLIVQFRESEAHTSARERENFC